ncbi:MAG: hypothetical protein AB7I41_05805 [Candidatus Sericytochromatia bacterium]
MYKPLLIVCLLLGVLPLSACQLPVSQSSAQAGQTVNFLNLRVEEISAKQAVLRFQTSRETSCEAEFGLKAENLDRRARDPDMDLNNPYSIQHQVPLEDLESGQTYYLRARAQDPQGNVFYSELLTFQTPVAEALPPGLKALALGDDFEVAGVSSQFGGDDFNGPFGIHKAFDASMATEWSSQGDDNKAFVSLRFKQPQRLSHLAFRSREMTDGSSIIQSIRLILNEGEQVLGPFLSPDPSQNYLFALNSSLNITGLKIETVSSSGGNTGAREIRFYTK